MLIFPLLFVVWGPDTKVVQAALEYRENCQPDKF